MDAEEKTTAKTAEKKTLTLAQSILRDLKSMRSLWNYLFLVIYAWVSVYLVLYHADTCGTSVVYTTGGIVGSVFTNYCWASHMDKRLGMSQTPDAGFETPAIIDPTATAGEGDGNG